MPDGREVHLSHASCDSEPGLLPLATARLRLLGAAAPVDAETLALESALGRVLATAQTAPAALPPFDQAAMDGFGLHADDLHDGARPCVRRRIFAGDPAGLPVSAGEAVRILTGAPVPEGVAAVVMEEHASLDDGRLHTRRLPRNGDNIRRRGEDVAPGDQLVPPGTRLDARHIALLAATGIERVPVRRRLRVALLSNGNELGTMVRDSNRPMLRALLARPEIACTDLGVLPDDPARLAAELREAAGAHDLILSSGGVSGSDADHLPRALRAAGGAVTVLKLALKPGKPLAHGRLGAALCLFLPGNPLACLVGMLTLGRPLLARLAGIERAVVPALSVVVATSFARKSGREEFMPACFVGVDDSGLPMVKPAGRTGSARLKPLADADGLLWLPAVAEHLAAGDKVQFHPFAASFGLLA